MDFPLCKAKEYKGAVVSYLEWKADGHRVCITRGVNTYEAVTRTGIDIWPKLELIPQIVKAVYWLDKDTSIDCELHARHIHATDVKTLINERSEKLELAAFAVPYLRGRDNRQMPYSDARIQLGMMKVPRTEQYDVGRSEGFKLPCFFSDTTVDYLQRLAKVMGAEGFVAKEHHYDGWWKIKPVRSVDCVVMDYDLSTSDTYCGGLQGFTVGVYENNELKPIASVGSGFDAAFRMSCRPKEYVGRVCEVSYDSLAGKGRLKFPRFVRWRDDKKPEDCTVEQLNVVDRA